MSIENFKIYGERCSGTNYLTELMLNNFNLNDMLYEYDHKHFFGFYNYRQENNTLFLAIVRNPINWINSLSKDLWHIPKVNRDIEKLLSNRFYSVDFLNYEDNIRYSNYVETSIEIFIDKDVNFTNENRIYKNIFELRKVKNNFLIYTLPRLVKNYYFIRYEDLQSHPREIILDISQKYNIPLKHDIENVLYYKNLKDEIYKPRPLDLSNEIIQKIIDNVEIEQEVSLFKYDLYNIWKLSS